MAPVSGNVIAAGALRYRGHPYVYGVWDCSGFVNHVLGQDLGLTLPGGLRGYRGPPPHGPVVDDYQSWGSPVSAPARGDIVLFVGLGPNGHMGVVLGPDQMVSALDPAQGTLVTPIRGYGPPGAPIVYRRATGVPAGTPGGAPVPSAPGAGPPGGQQSGLRAAGAAVLIVAAMAGAVILAATLAGVAAVAVGRWAVSRAAG